MAASDVSGGQTVDLVFVLFTVCWACARGCGLFLQRTGKGDDVHVKLTAGLSQRRGYTFIFIPSDIPPSLIRVDCNSCICLCQCGIYLWAGVNWDSYFGQVQRRLRNVSPSFPSHSVTHWTEFIASRVCLLPASLLVWIVSYFLNNSLLFVCPLNIYIFNEQNRLVSKHWTKQASSFFLTKRALFF